MMMAYEVNPSSLLIERISQLSSPKMMTGCNYLASAAWTNVYAPDDIGTDPPPVAQRIYVFVMDFCFIKSFNHCLQVLYLP